jgi:hypothetical protein
VAHELGLARAALACRQDFGRSFDVIQRDLLPAGAAGDVVSTAGRSLSSAGGFQSDAKDLPFMHDSSWPMDGTQVNELEATLLTLNGIVV